VRVGSRSTSSIAGALDGAPGFCPGLTAASKAGRIGTSTELSTTRRGGDTQGNYMFFRSSASANSLMEHGAQTWQ